MHLTVAYMTSRKEPMIKWFFDSLHRECEGNYSNLKVVIIDFHAELPGRMDAFAKMAHCAITHVEMKPCVYQGKHRLTKIDYFAAANARNTAVCLAPDGWIVFVDDLSVLLPGWMNAIKEAMKAGYIVCGTYKKVLALVVENGEVLCFREHASGLDSRFKLGRYNAPVEINGGAMFGCSVAMPIEAILQVNGFDEDCDCLGLGSEDYICGLMLERKGWKIMYDLRMATLESEERHHWEPPMKRVIENTGSSDKDDASWKILGPVVSGQRSRAPNYWGEEGLAGLRQRILAGEPFPVLNIPEHSWYSGRHLSEF